MELYQSSAPKLCTELYQKLQLTTKSYHQGSELPASCSLTAKLADCLCYQPLGSDADSDADSWTHCVWGLADQAYTVDVDINRPFREQGLMKNTYTKDFSINCSCLTLEKQLRWTEDLLSISRYIRELGPVFFHQVFWQHHINM